MSWSRTILAFRGVGILLIGLGVRAPIEGVASWALDPDLWQNSSGLAPAASGRAGEVISTVRGAALLQWSLRNARQLLALTAGCCFVLLPSTKLRVPTKLRRIP